MSKKIDLASQIPLIAENLRESVNLKDWEVSTYLHRILKGVIHSDTIRKHLPEKYRRLNGKLETCEICGKKRIRSMKRHNKTSHGII